MRNTLKLIIRNLAKNPVSSFINIFGLAVSIALVLILSAYSFSEFFTDKFHNQNIFLVQPGKNWVYVPGILKPTIDNSLADVEKSIRIKEKWDAPVYQFKQNDPVESDLIFSDKEFFDLFTYEALEGNLKTALSEPMSAVISEKLANRLFGHKQAVGKSIKLDNKHYLTVKAVFKNQTSNTTFSFNSIVSLETMKRVDPNQRDLEKWNWSNYQTFLMLNDKTEIKEIQKKIIGLYPKEEQEHIKNLKLLPFQKIYFSGLKDPCNYLKTGNQSKVIYLSIVAILVLFVALVNFMNITSAHWLERIKQTGIMKVVGAKRSIITRNMLLETFILFIVSLILAYFIIFLIAPYLTQNTQIKFNPDLFLSAGYLLLTIGAVILLSVLCGIIPALKIAASQTLANLKKYTSVKRSKPIREGIMVSAQFIVAIVLILFTILIQKQVDFGSNNLGIAQENIVGIQLTEQLSEKKEVLKESLLAHANVNEVIFTQYFPGKSVSGWKFELQTEGEKKEVGFNTFSADAGFFSIMDLKLIDGRFYDDKHEADKHKVVVNEQFLRKYNITKPIGGKMPVGKKVYEIVGVVKDFHFLPVNEPINPLLIRNDKYASVALVKLKTSNFNTLKSSFEDIQNISDRLSPSFPVNVTFFDRAIEQLYESEIKFRTAFGLFAICSIIICCLGILAISLFTIQNRTKEIGIRKANGAKTHEIMAMLNKGFAKWVAIAFIIACPIAWYAMHKWLENFAYKTELSWWIFALSGIITVGIALLTVSWQSWRAAKRNPVESLRYE